MASVTWPVLTSDSHNNHITTALEVVLEIPDVSPIQNSGTPVKVFLANKRFRHEC